MSKLKAYKNGVYFDMPEKEYRGIKRENYSSVKTYLKSPRDYFKTIIQKQKEEDISSSLIVGSLVDIELTGGGEKEIDENFILASANKPTGQFGDLVDNITKLIKENYDFDNNIIAKPLKEIVEIAFNKTAYDYSGKRKSLRKGKTELNIQDCFQELKDNGGFDYIEEYTKSITKTLYSSIDKENAERCCTSLRTSPTSNLYFGYNKEFESNKDFSVYNQLVILYEYKGVLFKSKLDKLILDHKNKIATPIDLKTTGDSARFLFSYSEYKYFIQAALYTYSLEWALRNTKEFERYKDYKIMPFNKEIIENREDYLFTFIVAGYTNNSTPLKYLVNKSVIRKAFVGYINQYETFTPGIDYFCENINWHKENNVWDTTRELKENNGVITIDF